MKRALSEHPRLYRLVRRAQKIGRYYLRRPHEPEFRAFRSWSDPGLFLDVGANAGQSAMSFRLYNKRSPILSLEPNPAMEPELRFLKRHVLRSGFDFRMVGAGRADELRVLTVPVVNKVPITGEGSLDARQAVDIWWVTDEQVGTVEYRVPIVPIDGMGLPRVAYMKIDVEGTAPDVIHGARETISRDRPIILCEGRRAVPLLEALGYSRLGPSDSEIFLPSAV